MQMPGVARSLGADGPDVLAAAGQRAGSRTGTSSSAPSRRARGCSTSRIPTTRPARSSRTRRCGASSTAARRPGTWLARRRGVSRRGDRSAADDELLGHERSRHRDERPVEGVRDPGRADRLDRRAARAASPTAGRSTTTSRSVRTSCPIASRGSRSSPANRERCYARTRDDPRATTCRSRASGSRSFGGRLTWREPQAGAIALVRYDCRRRQPRDRRTRPRQPEHAHRPGRARRPRGLPAHLARRPRGVPAGRAAADRRRAAPGPEPRRVSERSERAHANGARRRSGARESVSGSPRRQRPSVRLVNHGGSPP